MLRLVPIFGLLAVSFAAAAPGDEANLSCALTAPIRAKPTDPPAEASVGGWWYANADRTIWAGWDAVRMSAGSKNGNKVLWFRPKGSELIVKARRVDADSVAAEIDIPCCYGGRLQASEITFPSDGCWQIAAKAANSDLVFVTLVYPSASGTEMREPNAVDAKVLQSRQCAAVDSRTRARLMAGAGGR